MSPSRFERIEPRLRERESFRHWTQEHVRFSDTDMVGHVSNTAYPVYCETGRVAFNRHVMQELFDRQWSQGAAGLMVARCTVNYRAETHYPSCIDVGTGVVSIGTSSYTLGQALFVEDRIVATSEAVIVQIDRVSRRPAPLDDTARARLTEWLLAPGSD